MKIRYYSLPYLFSTILILLLLMIGLSFLSANIGAMKLSLFTLMEIPLDDKLWHIWLNIRLPRVALAILVGFALSSAGVIMQGIFRNPLADPGLLGVSSGAALFVAIAIISPFLLPSTIPIHFFGKQTHLIPTLGIYAFCGSLSVCMLIYLLSKWGCHTSSRLLLAGIAINAICSAVIGLLSYLSNDQQLRQFTLWVMGSLSHATWDMVIGASILILPTLCLIWRYARHLNILQLGEEDAHYLGIAVARTHQQLLFLNALLVGAAVAVCGVIGFIGLVTPHLVRLYLGANHRWLLPGTALAGACLLLLSDTLARTLAAPAEIPIGILTSLIGGPYFFWLIIRTHER